MAVTKNGHWFHDMPPAQKKAYLAKHPTSKFHKLKGKKPANPGKDKRRAIDKYFARKEATAAAAKPKTKAMPMTRHTHAVKLIADTKEAIKRYRAEAKQYKAEGKPRKLKKGAR